MILMCLIIVFHSTLYVEKHSHLINVYVPKRERQIHCIIDPKDSHLFL